MTAAPPSHTALPAERSLVGAMLLDARVIDQVHDLVRPDEFASEMHKTILRGILAVRDRGETVDPITVEAELQRRGTPVELTVLVGMTGDVPTIHGAPSWARVIHETFRMRELRRAAEDLARHLSRGELSADEIASQHHGRIVPLVNGAASRPLALPPPPATETWRDLNPEWLSVAPEPRRWLMRHRTRDGRPAPPPLCDGLLPRGKVGLLVADGGVGKTMALVALAVSLITGRPWFDHFFVAPEAMIGRVALLLGEEDEDEVHRRLYAVSMAYGLTEEEQRKVAAQLVIVPLSGRTVSLVTPAGAESPALIAIRQRLIAEAGPEGWALVAFDPFSRFAAPESEVDNAIATRTIQAAETIVAVHGNPTVIIAHHAPQVAVSSGAIRARGVTGIRDAARWEAVLRADGRDILFRQTKSNYSRPMHDELRLIRGPHGILRVETPEEQEDREQRRADAKDAPLEDRQSRREQRISKHEGEILLALAAASQPPTSQKGLVGLVSGRTDEKQDAVARLLATGRIARPSGPRECYRVATPNGQGSLNLR